MKTRLLLLISLAATLAAGPIPINGYDINDAVLSGHGFWAHTYTGTITPSGIVFDNFGFGGQTATYSGVGGGTLTDGVIGTTLSDTQLFVVGTASDGTPINPVIFLTLPFAYTVDTIEIYGGDISTNFIPGAIESFDVEIFGPNGLFSDSFASLTKFGPGTNGNGDFVNTRAALAGSKLDGVPAFTVVLYNFSPGLFNWVSITEIKLDGNLYVDPNPIPEPSTIGLAAFALGAGLALRLRK